MANGEDLNEPAVILYMFSTIIMGILFLGAWVLIWICNIAGGAYAMVKEKGKEFIAIARNPAYRIDSSSSDTELEQAKELAYRQLRRRGDGHFVRTFLKKPEQ